MSLSNKQRIFSLNVSSLIRYIYANDFSCSLGEVYRTEEQAKLNAEKEIGIVDSLHCKRLAIDINLFSPEKKYLPNTEDYRKIGLYWKKLHEDNRWGGDFKRHADGNHFEMLDKQEGHQ